ncbi:MAG TPA: DUF1622 domain-containing protein [Pyrinomonadaceae bacterium]|jgi:uncharacterized membrane protein|nr:DUF1622 domain-containing protein [Pyrinomonadaceae bacterium]
MLCLIQETAQSIIGTPREGAAETTIINAVQWLRLIVETTGAIIIGMGVLAAAYQFVRALIPPQLESYNRIRLTLARYLALALEFQLGADILSTAIAPTWDQIGKLGAIAVIRTGLNYFLTREMREENQDKGERAEAKGKVDATSQADAALD